MEVEREMHATLLPLHVVLGLKSLQVREASSWERKLAVKGGEQGKLELVRTNQDL